MYVSIAIVLSAVETVILPSTIIPGIKLGLTNVITLIVLFEFGIRDAVVVAIFRILTISLMLGTLFTSTFFIGFSGLIVSLILMAVFYSQVGLSIFGISIISSVGHIMGQIIFVRFYIGVETIFLVAPYLIYIAVVTGIINAFIAKNILVRVKNHIFN